MKAKVQGVARVPLDKNEGSVKGIVVLGGARAPLVLPERLRTKGSGNLTRNHFAVDLRSTDHRFGLNHQALLFRHSRRRAALAERSAQRLPSDGSAELRL